MKVRCDRKTNLELVHNYKSLVLRLGYIPPAKECSKYTKEIGNSLHTIIREFGSYAKFLKICGFLHYLDRDNSFFILKFKKIVETLGFTPTSKEYKKYSEEMGISARSLHRKFGGYLKFLKLCGIPHRKNMTKEDCLVNFKALVHELGYVPDAEEAFHYTEKLGISLGTMIHKFDGKYNNILRACSFNVRYPGYNAEVVGSILEDLFPDLIREHSHPWLVNPATKYKLNCDFFIPSIKLYVEYDDVSHYDLDWYKRRVKNPEEKFAKRKRLDAVRDRLIPEHGFKLLRISYTEKLTKENIKFLLQPFLKVV